MGLDIHNLTDEQLEKIERENDHVDEWLAKKLGMERHFEGSPFDARNRKWWNCDRLILHPELFKRERAEWIQNELPEEMGTYVRNQFTGSTEKITKAKIQGVITAMNQEDLNWWHGADRKSIFLERFRLVHPLCCDGRKKSPAPVVKQLYPAAQKQQRQPAAPKAKGKRRNKQRKGCSLLGLIIIAVVIFVAYQIL